LIEKRKNIFIFDLEVFVWYIKKKKKESNTLYR